MSLSSLNSSELSSVVSMLQQPADNFGNEQSLEMMWAVRAYEHAEVYFNFIHASSAVFTRLVKIPLKYDLHAEVYLAALWYLYLLVYPAVLCYMVPTGSPFPLNMILVSVDPLYLRLSPIDDEIYEHFRKCFPATPIDLIDENEIKAPESKEKWRDFCNQFEGKVEDWNMATLLRLDCRQDVSESNTTIVPRIQFLAVEIARNREGLNSCLRSRFRPSADVSVKTS